MAGVQTSARRTAHDRDRGLARLRNLTRAAIVGATALAAIFAGVAAETVKGRSATLAPRASRRAVAPRRVPAPPTAPEVGAPAAAPQQAAPAPAPAPVPTPAPPVVVSGGS